MKKNILNSINNINSISNLIKIKILVVGGGGMKGLEFIGSLKYLYELNLLNNIEEYYGCSIGSYISLLLIIGYSIDEIINLSINFDYSMIIGKINNIFHNYSIGNYELYINIIKSVIKIKNFDSDITFKQLYDKTQKIFNVIGYNISQKKEVMINYITFPNMKIWEGVYLSCALPLLFKPYLYENEYYCDGGISNICPINSVPSEKQKYTLGVFSKIFTSHINIHTYIENKSFQNFFYYIFELLYVSYQKETYKHKIYQNAIWLESYDKLSMVRFNCNKEDKQNLIKKGYILCKNNILDVLNYLININKNNIN